MRTTIGCPHCLRVASLIPSLYLGQASNDSQIVLLCFFSVEALDLGGLRRAFKVTGTYISPFNPGSSLHPYRFLYRLFGSQSAGHLSVHLNFMALN